MDHDWYRRAVYWICTKIIRLDLALLDLLNLSRLFRGMLQFPEWMAKLTPFGHIPKLPVEDMDFMKVFMLTIIAILLLASGFLGYNKRDIRG